MARPRTPIGTFGNITYVKVAGGRVKARARFRDDDGQVRRVSATGASNKEAERNLKQVLAQRASHVASGEITGDTSFAKLVEVWLEDLDLENKLAPSTRALYERNMRQLVIPAFKHYLLREITVRKVDQFIKTSRRRRATAWRSRRAPFSVSRSASQFGMRRSRRTPCATPPGCTSRRRRRGR
jgi:hypothetical protein